MKQAKSFGMRNARRLSRRSAEVVPGNKMPFPGTQDRAGPRRRDRVLAGRGGGAQQQRRRPATHRAGPRSALCAQPSSAAPQRQSSTAAGADATSRACAYTLRSGIAEGRMVYIGVGGAIDGKVNPVLTAAEGRSCSSR